MELHHRNVYVCWHSNLTVSVLTLTMPVNQIYTLDHVFPVGILVTMPLQMKCKCTHLGIGWTTGDAKIINFYTPNQTVCTDIEAIQAIAIIAYPRNDQLLSVPESETHPI